MENFDLITVIPVSFKNSIEVVLSTNTTCTFLISFIKVIFVLLAKQDFVL